MKELASYSGLSTLPFLVVGHHKNVLHEVDGNKNVKTVLLRVASTTASFVRTFRHTFLAIKAVTSAIGKVAVYSFPQESISKVSSVFRMEILYGTEAQKI